jgi:hypothetical protein
MNPLVLLILAIVLSPAMGGGAGSGGVGSRVLYLGDSMSIGAFGQTFDSSLRSSGFQVHTVVAGGATPYYWLKSYQPLPCTIGYWEKSGDGERRLGYVRAVPKIEDLMLATKPNVVVVQTGINLYATLRSKRRPKEENVEEITSLIGRMCHVIAGSGALSYWVLPPHSHEERYSRELQEELASIMRAIVEQYGGSVFESREVTKFVDPYPATDGIHYGPAEARDWAVKVAQDFHSFMKVAPSPAPDALARAETRQLPAVEPAGPAPDPGAGDASAKLPGEVALRIRLEGKSGIANPAELDYANALGLYEYRVVKDLRGNYPFDRIRVAQGIVFGRKLTGAARAAIGSETELVLVPLSKYKNLTTWQIIDDLRPNFEVPVYTPKLD